MKAIVADYNVEILEGKSFSRPAVETRKGQVVKYCVFIEIKLGPNSQTK